MKSDMRITTVHHPRGLEEAGDWNLLRVEATPEAMPAAAEALVERGLPLLLTAPAARDRTDLETLEARLGARVSWAIEDALSSMPGLARARALAAGGRLPPWRKLEFGWRAARPTQPFLLQAGVTREGHDAVVAALAAAVGVLDGFGCPPARVELDTPVDGEYRARVRLKFADAGGRQAVASVFGPNTNTPRLPRPSTGFLSAEGGNGSFEWTFDGGVERLSARVAGRPGEWRSERENPTELAARALVQRLERPPALADFRRRYADWLERATQLARQYLYGHHRDVLRAERVALGKTLAAAGPFWEHAKVAQVSPTGTDLFVQGDAEATRQALLPLARPFRVLLVRAPVWAASDARFPPLSLAQLKAALRATGAEVEVLDLAVVAVAPQSIEDLDFSDPAMAQRVQVALAGVTGHYDLIGVSLMFLEAWPFVEREILPPLRARTEHLVLGGRVAGWIQEERRTPPVSSIIVGEADLSLALLAQRLAAGRDLDGIPGLWDTRKDRASVPVAVAPDLSTLPCPDFTGISLSRYDDGSGVLRAAVPHLSYYAEGSGVLRTPFLPYLFQLGCPHRCAYCADESARRVRSRSPQQVVDDLRTMRDRHGVRDFFFLNNLINASSPYLAELLAGLRRARLGIRWMDCARVTGMTDEVLQELAATGCVQLTYGLDLGSDRMLRLMRKDSTLDEAEDCIRRTAKAGIRTQVNLIVGMPHETDEDFASMREVVRRLGPYAVFNPMRYHYTAGSPVYNEPARFGLWRRGETFDFPDGRRWEDFLRKRDERYAVLARDLRL